MQTQLPIVCRKTTDNSLVVVIDIIEEDHFFGPVYKTCHLIKYVDMDGLAHSCYVENNKLYVWFVKI